MRLDRVRGTDSGQRGRRASSLARAVQSLPSGIAARNRGSSIQEGNRACYCARSAHLIRSHRRSERDCLTLVGVRVTRQDSCLRRVAADRDREVLGCCAAGVSGGDGSGEDAARGRRSGNRAAVAVERQACGQSARGDAKGRGRRAVCGVSEAVGRSHRSRRGRRAVREGGTLAHRDAEVLRSHGRDAVTGRDRSRVGPVRVRRSTDNTRCAQASRQPTRGHAERRSGRPAGGITKVVSDAVSSRREGRAISKGRRLAHRDVEVLRRRTGGVSCRDGSRKVSIGGGRSTDDTRSIHSQPCRQATGSDTERRCGRTAGGVAKVVSRSLGSRSRRGAIRKGRNLVHRDAERLRRVRGNSIGGGDRSSESSSCARCSDNRTTRSNDESGGEVARRHTKSRGRLAGKGIAKAVRHRDCRRRWRRTIGDRRCYCYESHRRIGGAARIRVVGQNANRRISGDRSLVRDVRLAIVLDRDLILHRHRLARGQGANSE